MRSGGGQQSNSEGGNVQPTMRPQAIPAMAARGIEVADWPRETCKGQSQPREGERRTPPTKTTISSPSRSTVIKGIKNSVHLPP